ncbi:MAG: hypothetical protein R3B48_03310 [Kofleriaceae bacterium]
MGLEAARVKGKSLAREAACQLGAFDKFGVSSLKCGKELEITMALDREGKAHVAAVLYSMDDDYHHLLERRLRELIKANGEPCAYDRSLDGANYSFWGFLHTGERVKKDGPGCYPLSKKEMGEEVDSESRTILRCHPSDRQDYIVFSNMTSYGRNDEDLGYFFVALSCSYMAEAMARKELYDSLE